MIPLIMKVKIPRESKKPVILYFPLFLVWILVFGILLILLPFFLIGAVLAWHSGYGKLLLLLIPMLFNLIWHLKGLLIDVESRDDKVFMKFI